MITITQGSPTEQQIWVVYGIVLYLIAAPLVIITAGLCGLVARQRLINKENAARSLQSDYASASNREDTHQSPLTSDSGVGTAA